MKGVRARLDRERALVQYGAWLNGRLAGIAVNDPKHYPPPQEIIDLGSRRPRKRQSDDEIERIFKNMHTAMTGEIIQ